MGFSDSMDEALAGSLRQPGCVSVPRASSVDSTTSFGAASAPHILVVEDEEQIARTLALLLKRVGYRVSKATRGVDAVAQILACREQGERIDLMICDVSLVDVMSPQLIDELAGHGIRLPVLSMTGLLDEDIIDDLKKRGYDKCLVKPFRKEELLAAVSECLNDDERVADRPAERNEAVHSALHGNGSNPGK